MTGTPEETALYHVFGDEELLLYIGISKDFGERWKREATEFIWWNEKRWMTVRWYASRPQAAAAEKAAIETEGPKYNIDHAVVPLALPRRVVPFAPLVPRIPSLAEISGLPVAMDLPFAARLLGIPKGRERALVRNGRFPCTVYSYSRTFSVRKADLVTSLGFDMEGKPLAQEPGHVNHDAA
jgi:hypothetical protein